MITYKTNTPEFYIDSLYRHTEKLRGQAQIKFELDSGLKLKHAFGNTSLDGRDVWSETGTEDLQFERFGYGGLAILGSAVYFSDKKEPQLFYKSKTIQQAIKSYVRTMDYISEEQRETLKFIEEQHGRPKVQHCIIMSNVKGLFNRI